MMSAIKAPLPRKLELEIGGFPGPWYSLKYEAGILFYSVSQGGQNKGPRKIAPTPKDWADFLISLETLDVWSWQKNYMPEAAICDGTQWSVWITWGKKSVRSEGDNVYPENFDLFIRAVRKLIGGLEFY